jgi:hypothetical protein
MMRRGGYTDSHCAPPLEELEKNRHREPDGERIRRELVEWITRNKVVSVMLDTEQHCVSIDIVKLPPRIKPVLTRWGSIYVDDGLEETQEPMIAPRKFRIRS